MGAVCSRIYASYDRASEFTPLETPSVFSPVHRDGRYSISTSVFGKNSRIFIICGTNFCLFEIHTDFEIYTLRNSDFASCAKFSVSKITRYTVLLCVLLLISFFDLYKKALEFSKLLAHTITCNI